MDKNKNFQGWHKKKTAIQQRDERPNYHQREVWWCSIGENVGFEQDGKGEDFARPVLIMKGFSKEVFICLPLTTKNKTSIFYHDIDLGDGEKRKVILSQIKLTDAKRLQEKIATINQTQFEAIKQAAIRLLE